jgi:hypothetical protein
VSIEDLEARIVDVERKYETLRLAALDWGNGIDTYSRLIDKLWQRVEALEAAQQKIRSGRGSPLVGRVANAIAAQATSAGIVNDRPSRAAILEVAAWLRGRNTRVAASVQIAGDLEKEANQ